MLKDILILLSSLYFLSGCATNSPPTPLDAMTIQEQIEVDKFNSKAIRERFDADRFETMLNDMP